MKNQIRELDGLRGLAVTLVMAFHLFPRAAYFTDHPFLLKISSFTSVGWVGVDIFFTLSGFLITSILLRAKEGEHYFRNFYARRALRIFPLYYVTIALFLTLAVLAQPEFAAELGIAVPVMVFYQQNWTSIFGGFHMPQFLAVTWSLAIEEQFYFIWPFVVYKLNKEKLLQFGVGYIIVSFIFRLLVTLFWPDIEQVNVFFYFASFARFEEVLVGGLLAILLTYDNQQEKIRRVSPALTAISLVSFSVLCLLSLPVLPHPVYSGAPLTIGGYTSSALFAAGLIGIFLTYPPQNILRKIFGHPILTFLGKYSYSMYLFHVPVGFVMRDILWDLGMRGWKPFVLYLVASYGLTILIALITWNLLEKHILNLKKYFEYRSD
jgi:peptidoglycan/LPS O-acetylase OafA/YrhL